jgi:type I restriction enzyme S subunit
MDALPSEGLPPGWTTATLGDIADFVMGQAPASSHTNFDGVGTPFVKTGEFGARRPVIREWTTRPLKMAKTSDVLICVVGATVGKLNLGADCAIGRSVAAIRPKPGVAQEYIYRYLETRIQAFRSASMGTAQGVISSSMLRDEPIPLAPTAEQTRIVAAVNALFEEVEAGEAALARAREGLTQFRASLLHTACTGALTADWRAANPTNETADDLLREIENWRVQRGLKPLPVGVQRDVTDLPSLPAGWRWASLPQLGEFGRGKSKHRPRDDARLYGDAMPFIQTGDVSRSKGRISVWSKMYSDFGVAQSKIWPAGTVCITIAANIAASGILAFEACFPDSVVGLVTPHAALSRYVELFMRTARANLDAYAPATAQKNINLEILNTIAVPIPPLSEIEAIVRTFDEVQSEALEPLDAMPDGTTLRQSILHAAFTGRLVPQDPADEPAAALLARLRATPAASRRARARRATTQPDLIETPA